MKRPFCLFFTAITALLLASCKDKLNPVGESVLPDADAIMVCTDTFHAVSGNYFAPFIYSRTDSFLIGSYYDRTYGNTQADLLAQLACPEGYEFPEGAEVDSAAVFIYYSSYFGYPNAAVRFSVYQMDLGTFSYGGRYPSNLELGDYCSLQPSTLLGQTVVSALHPADSASNGSTYVPYIRIPLDSLWTRQFFDGCKSHMQSLDDFNRYFNGLYITTDFGSATMFNAIQVDLDLYYHFSYVRTDGVEETVSDQRIFPANNEVRQVNRFVHTDVEQVVSRLSETDTVGYLVTPACLYTRVVLPLGRICDTISSRVGSRDVRINGAYLKLETIDTDTASKYLPPTTVMIIMEDSVEGFFNKQTTLSSTFAGMGYLTAEYDTTGTATGEYYYRFNLSSLIENQLKLKAEDSTPGDENMLVIPISTTATSAASITSSTPVEYYHLMSAVKLRSAQNRLQPMKLSVVYCGY